MDGTASGRTGGRRQLAAAILSGAWGDGTCRGPRSGDPSRRRRRRHRRAEVRRLVGRGRGARSCTDHVQRSEVTGTVASNEQIKDTNSSPVIEYVNIKFGLETTAA